MKTNINLNNCNNSVKNEKNIPTLSGLLTDKSDKSYISKTEMEEKLIALLGGRAAEKIALNEIWEICRMESLILE